MTCHTRIPSRHNAYESPTATLGDDLEVLRTLGVGSFGRVKLARAALSHALWDASGKPPRPGSDLGDPGSGNGMCRVFSPVPSVQWIVPWVSTRQPVNETVVPLFPLAQG